MNTTRNDGLSRRTFLRVAGGALGGAWLTLDLSKVAQAAHDAHEAREAGALNTSFLSRAELADVDAITAQIIPTDDTPGAREAGVALFIDRALATFFGRMAPDFRSQLAAFRLRCQAQHPDAGSFAALSNEQQIAFLKQVDRTPFFERVRLLTLVGMFAMPKYGGNRDGIGWKLLGFQDQHIFTPPFGYYDRDYPGFKIEVVSKS
ncbi:MAG TPA: gluconate 2-dehydrogenase subunit 3 family protein [Steroidobacteraceae bacterium]|nr:gluconate 2-dehydrogenase subunit 3 family protein [Steroidobacteraceae bacterium]